MPCYDAFHGFVYLVFVDAEHEGSDKKEVDYQGSAGYVIETL